MAMTWSTRSGSFSGSKWHELKKNLHLIYGCSCSSLHFVVDFPASHVWWPVSELQLRWWFLWFLRSAPGPNSCGLLLGGTSGCLVDAGFLWNMGDTNKTWHLYKQRIWGTLQFSDSILLDTPYMTHTVGCIPKLSSGPFFDSTAKVIDQPDICILGLGHLDVLRSGRIWPLRRDRSCKIPTEHGLG